jgi:uncharacterized membrane protein YeaQ/YmgE (transglycosylase-associated protein family)
MGILAWVILGALAGWIASIIMKTDEQQGAFGNIVVGIIGALVGGFLFSLFGGSDVTGLNLYSLIVAVVGSMIVLFIYKSLRKSA